jgi:Domain of unknown function (DUF5658)
MTTERLHQLFLLNISLQMFDGVATYQGISHHWAEGNPILIAAMATLGVGPALLLFKAKACGFLVLLRRRGPRPIIQAAFSGIAAAYLLFSFVPWMSRLLSLLAV